MKNYKTKSQTWSFDIMLAVVIFLSTIFFFFLILNNAPANKVEELESEASKVLEDTVSEDFGLRIADSDVINETRLEELLGNYSDIKRELQIKNEFCIYFEDQEGNIIYINISQGKSYTGIGSDIINVSNISCG